MRWLGGCLIRPFAEVAKDVTRLWYNIFCERVLPARKCLRAKSLGSWRLNREKVEREELLLPLSASPL